MADQLLSEIMYNILSRLPLKSLARFRCVSKLWCNYINDPYFQTMHAQLWDRKRWDRKFIMFQQSKQGHHNSPCTVSYLEYNEEEAGSCTRVAWKKPVMDIWCKNHSSFFRKDKNYTSRRSNSILLGSCNGLLFSSRGSFSSKGQYEWDTLIVINPIRKECYELPPLDRIILYYSLRSAGLNHDYKEFRSKSCGLGFDNSTQTFKMVLCIEYPDSRVLCTMVHVLGTKSWRQIHQVPSYPITGEGVFANECLYWLVTPAYENLRVLISFDMAKEEFGLIALPRQPPYWISAEQLVDLHGQLGYVCDIFRQNITVVWILKKSRWVRHCEFEMGSKKKVLGFCNEDGDLLMKARKNKMNVYKLKSESLHEVKFVGLQKRRAIDKLEILSYQSSLFLTRYSIKYPE